MQGTGVETVCFVLVAWVEVAYFLQGAGVFVFFGCDWVFFLV